MPVKIKPITKKQIREITESYAAQLPDWRLVGGQALIRHNGPILQSLSFEALRSGGYRPSSAVEILVSPTVTMLRQFLDLRHREILLRDHETMQGSVFEAMKTQFEPSIVHPLDAIEVLRLCERSSSDRISDACAIAALAAFLGESSLAQDWCDKSDAFLESLGREPAEWEQSQHEFIKRLEAAVKSNCEREILESEMQGKLDRFI